MFDWNEDRVEALTAYWDQGLSASEISSRLPGTTRNSVIGKVHRLGLPRRADSPGHATAHATMCRQGARKGLRNRSREAVIVARTRRGTPKSDGVAKWHRDGAEAISREPLPGSKLLALVDLEAGDCRFPHDTDTGRKFCGCAQVPGLPYCESHVSIAYRPIQPITRETEHFRLFKQGTFTCA